MKRSYTYLCIVFVFLLSACGASRISETEILWDTWGVPHVYAANEGEMFYALGWAQMHNHGNLILELFGTSRGRASEYWGQEHVISDMMIHGLGLPELAAEWTRTQDPEHAELMKQALAGMNAYAAAHPEAFEEKNKVVLPLQIDDLNLHTLFVFYTRFVGGGDLGTISRWGETGSNTYAVGPSRSESGKAMLVQNPHLPWGREFLFFESHGIAPGVNIYGANLVGLPGFGIAFNENLGWSHTNNTIDNADSYELTLKDGGYVLDGEVKPITTSTKILKIKGEDGNMIEKEILVQFTEDFGHILKVKGDKAISIKFPALDRVDAGKQWYEMGKSKSFADFETALKKEQIPFWNVMYADKSGNIYYLFNGHVPHRKKGDWTYWDRVIPTSSSEDVWTDVHAYSDLPKVKNPETGWLQNANDPPWTSTNPMAIDPKDYPAYMAPPMVPYYFRPQRSMRQLADDESISFDELVDYKLSSRNEMADRLLDDLFTAVDQFGDEKAKEAKKILESWDRNSRNDSKGAMLFYQWAQRINPYSPSTYAKSWTPTDIQNTPDGLSDPKAAAQQLSAAADFVVKKFGSMDVAWGDAVRLRIGKYDLPANGSSGLVGVFRVSSPAWDQDGKMAIRAGDSWVSVLEFGDKVKAKGLLSYGNATQKDSPHHGDQLELYSKEEMRDLWYYRQDVEANLARREVLDGKVFREKN